MDSIASITKKHCHCITNIICGILLTLLAAINIIQTIAPFDHIYYIICSAVTGILALFTWIYIAGLKVGCSLVRIPLIIITVLSFAVSLFSISIGILFINHNGVENYINGILAEYGYRLAISAELIGILLIVGGIFVFGFSFCLLAGVRYFDSIKCCLNSQTKRGGARLFGISSIVLFVIITGLEIAYTVFLISSNQFGKLISEFPVQMLYLKLIFIDLLFLFIGISSNSFANRTYAFKLLENQMMKIETNADGTVYVPINEDFEFLSYNTKPTAKSAQDESEKKHKPFIKEGQIIQSSDYREHNQPMDEKNII